MILFRILLVLTIDDTIDIVKNNYTFAVTTKRSRFINNKFNSTELPRVPVNKTDNMFKFFLKIKTIYEDIKFKKVILLCL